MNSKHETNDMVVEYLIGRNFFFNGKNTNNNGIAPCQGSTNTKKTQGIDGEQTYLATSLTAKDN